MLYPWSVGRRPGLCSLCHARGPLLELVPTGVEVAIPLLWRGTSLVQPPPSGLWIPTQSHGPTPGKLRVYRRRVDSIQPLSGETHARGADPDRGRSSCGQGREEDGTGAVRGSDVTSARSPPRAPVLAKCLVI
ncbi:hypothetical protein AOLI_G00328670 [Acnodon oligacanthus]